MKAPSPKKTALPQKEAPVMLPLVAEDPWMHPFSADVDARHGRYKQRLAEIEGAYGSLRKFASAYEWMGFTQADGGWWYREWAPAARELSLVGDFNHWNHDSHPLMRREDGVWEIFIQEEGFGQGSKVKVRIKDAHGFFLDRLPAYTRYTVQDPVSHDFAAIVWADSAGKKPKTKKKTAIPALNGAPPLIYECHTGMAQEKEAVGTYREFADNILPRIHALGYNTIQMMAVQEHPYYGSFGYHVSNFFAASSRFGTPDDLKYLIRTAHEMGIAEIMDIVHSHAVKNIAEGLNDFDGSGNLYFHPGSRGYHEGWDSKRFDYGRWEVQQFLLSNCAFWLEEFDFDGYRFDGVTSLLYLHMGNISFGNYDAYFKEGVDWDAETYLALANTLIHEIKPGALSIAEDMSGMPGMCRKPEEGGFGFDYRLGMGIPDYWIKTLKHTSDENWDLFGLWHELSNRRAKEKTIAYAESHDQALVGDKTIAFWLMDAEMYTHMSIFTESLVVDRGIALHKLIRLVTASVGGEGYLTFIGNEFGHPEWVDFPREGNDWSYRYARRQWSLPDTDYLRYKHLYAFDGAMIALLSKYNVLADGAARQLYLQNDKKLLAYARGGLIFVINLHPTDAATDFRFGVPEAGKYEVVLDSDNSAFGGFDRVDNAHIAETFSVPDSDLPHLSVYIPNRMALVLRKIAQG